MDRSVIKLIAVCIIGGLALLYYALPTIFGAIKKVDNKVWITFLKIIIGIVVIFTLFLCVSYVIGFLFG